MVVCLRKLYHHLLSVSSKMSFVSLLLCSLMMCANNQVHSGLVVVFVCLYITLSHYHHYTDLSEGILLLKCLSVIFGLECVSKIKSILSIMFHAIYGAVCIQLTHFSYNECQNTCTLSYYHHQIGSTTHLHCLGLGHETMVCAVCLSIILLAGRKSRISHERGNAQSSASVWDFWKTCGEGNYFTYRWLSARLQ